MISEKRGNLDEPSVAAVLRDEATPAVALEVITKEVRAVPFFEALMGEAGVLGEVVVKP
jgi:hypothetical protein